MRRFQKKQLLEIMMDLHTLHQDCKEHMEQKAYEAVCNILSDCQDFAIQIGEAIDKIEGEGTAAVAHLEHYCESIYRISIHYKTVSPYKAYKSLETDLKKAELAIEHLTEKIEAVFLPYKASMWDSLESVWQTADADPNCEAYVIPIPYYDKNADGSFGKEHYEGDKYPDYVPITDYNDYNYEGHHPDVIFIHNPYDQYNNVTSIHPFFYSKNLKKFTDLLVYIPYYSTSGGMSVAQRQCIAYYYVDYIVMQSEKYRKFFEADLPDEKFLPFGSPKFDKAVNICKNPLEPPEAWKGKLAGKTVYFYNTSIAGMLGNTPVFLKKMEYVFRCFAGKKDVCLLWRPHPLLEPTFDSMRSEYRPIYDALKRYFLESDVGIYDDTTDMMNAIAISDVYIGDAGTSVVSLFGIMGKPIVILNNHIDCEPRENDWKGEIIKSFFPYGNHKWMITQGNKLYHADHDSYKYHYCYDLCDYAYGTYYSYVINIRGKDYVCPVNAQNILVVNDREVEEKIELEHCLEQKGIFFSAIGCDNYLFLIPKKYPAIVKYDTVSGRIDYYREHLDIFRGAERGENGGYCVQNGYLFLGSPIDNRVLAIHAKTGTEQILTINANTTCGCFRLISDGTYLWSLPYSGNVVIRWNPENGETREYTDVPPGLQCRHPILGYEQMEKPFSRAAFCGDYVYLTPGWSNMYVRLNKKTGVMSKWDPPFEVPDTWENGYFISGEKGHCGCAIENADGKVYLFFVSANRKTYAVNLETNDVKEICLEFDLDELKAHEAGFQEYSEWLPYVCLENAFNSLPNILDGNVIGNQFDKERALHAYKKIVANNDGTSGEKIYQFVCDKLFRTIGDKL